MFERSSIAPRIFDLCDPEKLHRDDDVVNMSRGNEGKITLHSKDVTSISDLYLNIRPSLSAITTITMFKISMFIF